MCAEITMGGIPATLDMISVSVSANLGNSSGNLEICRTIYIGPDYSYAPYMYQDSKFAKWVIH